MREPPGSEPGRPGGKGPMAPTLSERIVACLLGLAKRIEAWVEAHGADGLRGGDVRAGVLLLPEVRAGLGAGRRGPGAGAAAAAERPRAAVGGLAGGGDGLPRGPDLAGRTDGAGAGGRDDPRPRRSGRGRAGGGAGRGGR